MPTSDMSVLVAVNGLAKKFGKTQALQGVDLQIGKGEFFGLIGPDGAGKTTLIRILCGLLKPDSGQGTIEDFDVSRQRGALRKILGYMPQRFSLYQDLTVKENLLFFADIYGVSRRERRLRIERLLQFSRLGPFLNRRAQALSGGMKQKLALSCTLIHKPALLLLDEPTTGVDPLSRREFWDILFELRREGVTILVTTPYMDEAGKCDRIAFIHRGRILAVDAPSRIPQLFPHHILLVRARDLRGVKARLAGIEGILAVKTFGDRLHLTTPQPEAVRTAISKLGFEANELTIEETPAGIEDTFMALMGEQ